MKFTEKAKLAAIKYIKESGSESALLKISVVGGGCSGLSYKLELVCESKDHVIVIKEEDLTVITDPKSFLFISDLEVDYSDGLNGTGFNFRNPKAKRTCGCGLSFSS
jgi:iron-sulfur cluster assembly protein